MESSFADIAVRAPSAPRDLEAIFALFDDACRERGWPADDGLRRYLPSSLIWGGYRGDELVCALQVVTESPLGFPIQGPTAWPELSIAPGGESGAPAEVAMVAVRRDARRRRLLFAPLYFQLFHHCQAHGIDRVYSILDRVIARLYRGLGLSFEQVGAERVYWNEPCFPALLRIQQLGADLQRTRPNLWAQLCAWDQASRLAS